MYVYDRAHAHSCYRAAALVEDLVMRVKQSQPLSNMCRAPKRERFPDKSFAATV